MAPRPASARLASLSQEWRPLERSSEWSLLSRPDLPGCLGRDKRGRYGYLLGSLGSELFQPLSLPIVVTAVHTFVGGPVSNFWLHGRDDAPAGSPVNDGPARRQYAEIVEFEVSGRNVDRALAALRAQDEAVKARPANNHLEIDGSRLPTNLPNSEQ